MTRVMMLVAALLVAQERTYTVTVTVSGMR